MNPLVLLDYNMREAVVYNDEFAFTIICSTITGGEWTINLAMACPECYSDLTHLLLPDDTCVCGLRPAVPEKGPASWTQTGPAGSRMNWELLLQAWVNPFDAVLLNSEINDLIAEWKQVPPSLNH